MDFGMKLVWILVSVIALLPALTLHEWAHGFAAYKLGDTTAKADGRLSLNPLDHLDPTGALMMLLVGFGWAKPVPVNTRRLKNPRRDLAIISLAGPLMNFFVALISSVLYAFALLLCNAIEASEMTTFVVEIIFQSLIIYNIGLGTFNLIPLPPLDGSNVLMCFLPPRAAAKYSKIRYYTQYIFLGIILLTYLPYPLSIISDIFFMPLEFIRDGLLELLISLTNLILGLFY